MGGCSRGAWPRVAKGVHTRLPDSVWDALLAAWSTIPGARACHPPPPPVTPRDSGARLSIHLGTNGDQISVLDVYEKIPSALLDRRLRFRARVAQAGGFKHERRHPFLLHAHCARQIHLRADSRGPGFVVLETHRQRLGFYGLSSRLLNSPCFFFPLGEAGSLV